MSFSLFHSIENIFRTFVHTHFFGFMCGKYFYENSFHSKMNRTFWKCIHQKYIARSIFSSPLQRFACCVQIWIYRSQYCIISISCCRCRRRSHQFKSEININANKLKLNLILFDIDCLRAHVQIQNEMIFSKRKQIMCLCLCYFK